MEEIHLIHHSHTDLGYTDLASTAMALHADFIRQAVDFADATADFLDESQFRWTCESLLMVEKFLQASAKDVQERFHAAVRREQIQVTAMPDNITGLCDAAEWNWYVRRYETLWNELRVRVAMQNDINGFPWGLLPCLRKHGIETVWMGCNSDTSVPLTPVPDAWWWEGPDAKRTLVWSGTHYCFGFELFHASEWRRGPVPSAGDVWFNPPSPGETWKTSKDDLDASERILREKLAKMDHYKFPVVAFQVTNHWRMDNDPPSPQIADFVKAWNADGRQPKLVMSTPSRFLSRLRETSTDQITTVRRGDWQDWWSDGICTAPELLVASQGAKRILADLPCAARLLGARQVSELSDVGQVSNLPEARQIGNLPREYDDAWHNALLFDEHTWGSYNSIAQPYHPRSAGGFAEKAAFAYRAAEQARLARTNMFRQSRDYCDFSRTRSIRVLNPGSTARSGWVVIPATAIRFPAKAAKDLATREVFRLEDIRESEWSKPDLSSAPYDRPNDVWTWHIKQRRFFLADLAPGQVRDFELIDDDVQREKQVTNRGLRVAWDEAAGRIASLRTDDGTELVDSTARHGLGQIVVETLKSRGQRYVLADRDQALLSEQFRVEPVKLIESRLESSPYAATLVTAWEHPLLHRVEQRWEILNCAARAELTTTIWTKEVADPCGLYLAFPLSIAGAEIVYDSVGHETVFGRDNMPGTCAESLCHNAGVILRSPRTAILLATPDTPLGCPGDPTLRRRLIAPYTPPNSHYYVNVVNNYWHTNFSIVKAGKLVLRHWIEPADARHASIAMLSDELWTYPIAAPAEEGHKTP